MDATKQIALERVHILFRLARENAYDRPDLAQKYVNSSRKIAMRARL